MEGDMTWSRSKTERMRVGAEERSWQVKDYRRSEFTAVIGVGWGKRSYEGGHRV